ncbi:hypothetical protein OPQ81_004954 [Rhizoctonia solani]|nr:hypothetical protein OPQ81_004954 [Rhizoctonia solani]
MISTSWSNGYYYMRESMNMSECEEVVQKFKQHSGYRGVSRTALVTTSEVLPTAGLVSLNIPLINYDVPNNVDDYIKRINNWRDANPNYCNMIITFVASDTNGMQVLGDFKRYFGVQVGELLWDGKKIY